MLRSQGLAASSAPDFPSPERKLRRLNVLRIVPSLTGEDDSRPGGRRAAYIICPGNVHGRVERASRAGFHTSLLRAGWKPGRRPVCIELVIVSRLPQAAERRASAAARFRVLCGLPSLLHWPAAPAQRGAAGEQQERRGL